MSSTATYLFKKNVGGIGGVKENILNISGKFFEYISSKPKTTLMRGR